MRTCRSPKGSELAHRSSITKLRGFRIGAQAIAILSEGEKEGEMRRLSIACISALRTIGSFSYLPVAIPRHFAALESEKSIWKTKRIQLTQVRTCCY
jgi:hypothetical protein